jgi:outer membrane lipoprotein carrier protein
MISAFLFLLSASGAGPLDAAIRRLEDHYNRLNTLKASFVQIYREDARSPAREEAGVIYLRKPGKMRWEYARPDQKLFLSDGKTVYFYVPSDKQVTRMPVDEAADARLPLRFLLGKLNIRRTFGRVELPADAAPLDPGNTVLRLYPKQRKGVEEMFQELLLEIDQRDRIRRLVVYETGGARSEFRLTGEEPNPRLDQGLFRFDIPPGVEVVDERSRP